MSRRGATRLSGILVLDKPPGMTSHDVVSRIRRATGEQRVGHAGTLDPAATGVLVVLVGPMTRLSPYVSGQEKTYRAEVVFGTETDTDDAEGETGRVAPVPAEVADRAVAERTVAGLVGVHEQTPPAYSAVKVDGRKAYEVARSGAEPQLASRTVEVRRAELVDVVPGPPPVWVVELAVSKGTYVRSIARDLGRALDSAAHLGALRRTASGALTLDDAHTLDEAEAAAAADTLPELFADPVRALGLWSAELPADRAADVAVGRTLRIVPPACVDLSEGEHVALTHRGRLLAVYARRGDDLAPDVVLAGGAP